MTERVYTRDGIRWTDLGDDASHGVVVRQTTFDSPRYTVNRVPAGFSAHRHDGMGTSHVLTRIGEYATRRTAQAAAYLNLHGKD